MRKGAFGRANLPVFRFLFFGLGKHILAGRTVEDGGVRRAEPLSGERLLW